MQRLGFIHDMMDVKVLILFVAARSSYPMTTQELYELCYQDECLSYFDVCTAVPEMIASGHLREQADGRIEITEKGREQGALLEDSIAYSVKRKAEDAVARFNRQLRRSSFIRTQLLPRDSGEYSVVLSLDDEMGNLMTLELVAPDERQGVRLTKMFEKRAEALYNLTMNQLLEAEDEIDG
ncbi:MAG: DUF4364 family protein [Faecousia sp.]